MQRPLPTRQAEAAHGQLHGRLEPRRSTDAPRSHTDDDRLAAELERRMASARPRLMRMACAQGLAPDSAEDVVQETLLEAWRHLDRLYEPDAFDAWLGGICRNVCRRYAR